jgi:hypothetical protein
MIDQKMPHSAGDPPVDLITRVNFLIELIEKKELAPPLKYGNDLMARTRLGGGKPIDKQLFNSLRRAGKIKTYYPTPGRCLYCLPEIDQLIESTESNELLPAKHTKKSLNLQ